MAGREREPLGTSGGRRRRGRRQRADLRRRERRDLQAVTLSPLHSRPSVTRAACCATLASLCCLTSIARAQSVQSAPTVASKYQPGIDVLDYDVHLELPDTGAFLRGDVTVLA